MSKCLSLPMSKRVSISCQFRVNFVSILCHGILDIPDQKALQYVQSDNNFPSFRPSLPANMQISRLSSVPLQSDCIAPPASESGSGGSSKVGAWQEHRRSKDGQRRSKVRARQARQARQEQGSSTAPAPPFRLYRKRNGRQAPQHRPALPGIAPALPDTAGALPRSLVASAAHGSSPRTSTGQQRRGAAVVSCPGGGCPRSARNPDVCFTPPPLAGCCPARPAGHRCWQSHRRCKNLRVKSDIKLAQ
jgi:hypothetical protein